MVKGRASSDPQLQWLKRNFRSLFTRGLKEHHEKMAEVYFGVKRVHGPSDAGQTLTLLSRLLTRYPKRAPEILRVAAMPARHPGDSHMGLYELQQSLSLHEGKATAFLGLLEKARVKKVHAGPILRAVRHAFFRFEVEEVFQAANSALDSGKDAAAKVMELRARLEELDQRKREAKAGARPGFLFR